MAGVHYTKHLTHSDVNSYKLGLPARVVSDLIFPHLPQLQVNAINQRDADYDLPVVDLDTNSIYSIQFFRQSSYVLGRGWYEHFVVRRDLYQGDRIAFSWTQERLGITVQGRNPNPKKRKRRSYYLRYAKPSINKPNMASSKPNDSIDLTLRLAPPQQNATSTQVTLGRKPSSMIVDFPIFGLAYGINFTKVLDLFSLLIMVWGGFPNDAIAVVRVLGKSAQISWRHPYILRLTFSAGIGALLLGYLTGTIRAWLYYFGSINVGRRKPLAGIL